MGFAFLAPAFLAGLLALAIPVLIHLTHRQKAIIVPFPSLMFLEKVPFRSMRRQKIRHWLLFLLRCTALILLVGAFARPFIDRPSVAAALSSGAREVVILLDRSYSMAYGDRWQRANEAARAAIEELTPADRASLVFFSDVAELAVRPTPEKTVLLGALEAARLSSGTTRYAPALKLVQQLLQESDLPRREAVLITDFQKIGWRDEDDVQLPEDTTLRAADLSDSETSNLAVAGMILQREYSEGIEALVVATRLTNQGEASYNELEITLEVGEEPVGRKRINIGPNSSITVSFDPIAMNEELFRGTVRAGDDMLGGDNSFHFLVAPGEALSVLILEHARAGNADSFYLQRALEIGSRPTFRVEVKKLPDFQPSDLNGRSLVVLNDSQFPSGSPGRRLREFVEEGGGLLVAFGELGNPNDWLSDDAAALVPRFGQPIDRSAEHGGTLANFDSSHEVFEIFKAPRSGDFASGNFYRYRPLEALPTDKSLAGFDDGSVALAERTVGKGRVLVWASTFDRFWNDFALQPIYLPFVHQLAKYAAGYREARPWYVTGEAVNVADLSQAGIADGTEISVVSPSGEQSSSRWGRGRGLQLREQGFFELSWSDEEGERRAVVAANLDRTESDLSVINSEELAAAVGWRGADLPGLEGESEVTAEDRESRQAFWWYLLVGTFAFLAAETLLSNRLSPSPTK